jgi:DNA-binding transcriptional regulator YiaG
MSEYSYDETAKKCREVRKELGHTQQEMAQLMGVNLRTWQRWEEGFHKPHNSALLLLEELRQKEQEIPLADKCRKIREHLRVTKTEMAKMFSTSLHTWGYWEAGKRRPGIEARKKITKMFNDLLSEK